MENHSFIPGLADNGVFAFSHLTQKVDKAKAAFEKIFIDNSSVARTISSNLDSILSSLPPTWFEQGVNCKILSSGYQDWQKGKLRIKITLEFEPDEPLIEQTTASNQPESPLEEIRRMINQ